MNIIDRHKLLESLRMHPTPFKYNLYMTLLYNKVLESNPFAHDYSFISKLTQHYQALGDNVNHAKFSKYLQTGVIA